MPWRAGHRIISARSTPESVFERITTPGEAAALLRIVMAGRSPRVEPADVATGTGAGWVMAAFLRGGSARFNDDSSGAFYAAESIETAIAETQYHYARFLRDAGEGPAHLGVRSLLPEFEATPLDLRGHHATHAELYDPDPTRYAAAQAWAARERARGADGVLYDSVRRVAGECVAVFRPRCVVRCAEGERLIYEWDGRRFTRTLRATEIP
jgi:RES domain-containing protein